MMDKSWMKAKTGMPEYLIGLTTFLSQCRTSCNDLWRIRCPCVKCSNNVHVNMKELANHLICDGIDTTYENWIYHGEPRSKGKGVVVEDEVREQLDDPCDAPDIAEMVDDFADEFKSNPEVLVKVLNDAEKPLYPGCSKYTKLLILIRLFNLKAKYGSNDVFFGELLSVLKDMLPENNELPTSVYKAKRALAAMGMNYVKIHACLNDCILYRNQYEKSESCPVCDESRWRKKKNSEEIQKNVPAKVLWHIPLQPRLRRLFRSKVDAKNLTWHVDKKIDDRKLRHPSDSLAWKHVDTMWPDFGKDPRNLRLALSLDGINPHSNPNTRHSCWSVIVVVYNLPPWLCMKRKYMFLSFLISGPQQPGNNIDVYLSPLIDELKELWSGIRAFDACRGEEFTLRAALLWTISDYPAVGNLSGCQVKGYLGCLCCGENTIGQRLKHWKKIVYMAHRHFLPLDHPYRRCKKAFSGKQEFEVAGVPLSGIQTFEKVSRMKFKPFGKLKEVGEKRQRRSSKEKKKGDNGCWKKKSIFFELEYWKHLLIRHTLDVMHIEKNVCESIVGTLLNIPGKTKDGVKSRLDMVDMGIRTELAPADHGNRTYLPPSCFTLTKAEKGKFCQTLSDISVLDGYAANVDTYVSMQELKLFGLKSHDCHVLMQHFLPVAIESILPGGVRNEIIRLCTFFNILCSKVFDVSMLKNLQKDIVITMRLLEQFFPPSFFDIMVHLVVHLVREVELCGPVYLRWMYPFERYMKVLKGYVRNHNRAEGCIVSEYVAEESVEWCSEFLRDLNPIGLPKNDDCDFTISKGLSSGTVYSVELELLLLGHRCVVENSDLVQPYIE